MKTTFSLVLFVAALPVLAVAQNTPVPVSTNSANWAVDVTTNSALWAVDAVSTNLSLWTVEASRQEQLPDFVDSIPLQLALEPEPKPAARVAGVDFTTEGAVADAARAGMIWQALNPFAPVEFGNGYDNVTVDPHTRQPTGMVLGWFRFGNASHRR